MKTIRTQCVCPHCERENEMHTGDGHPSAGDVSICWECRRLAVFTETGGVRKPTPEEHARFMENALVRAAVRLTEHAGDPIEAAARMLKLS